MCGIFGYVGRDILSATKIQGAYQLQRHRGPDDHGIESFSINNYNICMAHQRLSIIDLSSAGHQPMLRDDEASMIIYNGELYNYLEIKKDLQEKDVVFKSKTDTEVVSAALRYWGCEKAVQKFNGMWAFAWMDFRAKVLWLSRDRMGEKPLYLHYEKKDLYFASELKTLLCLIDKSFSLNAQVVGEYLSQSVLDGSNDTFFEDIRCVPQSSLVKFDLSEDRLEPISIRYWVCPKECTESLNNLAIVEDVRELFMDSVRIRLRSDVPVGVLLSGGIDSSAITAAIKCIKGDDTNVKLFSAVSSDPQFDESVFIDRMARYLDMPVEKTLLEFSPDEAISLLEKTISYNDSPVLSFSNVAHLLLMQKARDLGITVILSGQGADELLCGYRKYLGFYIQRLVWNGRIDKAVLNLWQFWHNKTIINQFSLADAKRYLPHWSRNEKRTILGEKLQDFKPVMLGINRGMTLQGRQVLDLERFSVPTLTHYEDRMSMAMSREIRLPFLDHRLIEKLVPLPSHYKLNKGWSKYVFRQAMAPYLPDEITWRKDKQGFGNPQGEWLKNDLRDDVFTFFNDDSFIFKADLVNRKVLLNKYSRFSEQPHDSGHIGFREIFNPLALEIWLRKYEPWIAGI